MCNVAHSGFARSARFSSYGRKSSRHRTEVFLVNFCLLIWHSLLEFFFGLLSIPSKKKLKNLCLSEYESPIHSLTSWNNVKNSSKESKGWIVHLSGYCCHNVMKLWIDGIFGLIVFFGLSLHCFLAWCSRMCSSSELWPSWTYTTYILFLWACSIKLY